MEATIPSSAGFPARTITQVRAAGIEADQTREPLRRSPRRRWDYLLYAPSLRERPSRAAISLVVSIRYLATSGRVRRYAYPQSRRHINILAVLYTSLLFLLFFQLSLTAFLGVHEEPPHRARGTQH